MQPERDAKAELNRRSQACEVLADTGIRVARNGLPSRSLGEGWTCITVARPVFRFGRSLRTANGVYLSTPMLEEMESRAGIALPTCRDGFANRRLRCSANGIEIESAGGSFHSRLRCYLVLASLNHSLLANKVRDNCRHGRVETNYVEHSAVVRVSEGEAVGVIADTRGTTSGNSSSLA